MGAAADRCGFVYRVIAQTSSPWLGSGNPPSTLPSPSYCSLQGLQGSSSLLDLFLALAPSHPPPSPTEDLPLGLDVVIPQALGFCTDGDDLGVFVKDADEYV